MPVPHGLWYDWIYGLSQNRAHSTVYVPNIWMSITKNPPSSPWDSSVFTLQRFSSRTNVSLKCMLIFNWLHLISSLVPQLSGADRNITHLSDKTYCQTCKQQNVPFVEEFKIMVIVCLPNMAKINGHNRLHSHPADLLYTVQCENTT